mgnify:CR=1 FL=1
MNLGSDKKRREFVQNDENWELVGELNGLVREKMLTYKGSEWYTVEVRQNVQRYNAKTRALEYRAEWTRVGIWKLSRSVRAFTYGWSVDQIVKEIKRIDKEEKEK